MKQWRAFWANLALAIFAVLLAIAVAFVANFSVRLTKCSHQETSPGEGLRQSVRRLDSALQHRFLMFLGENLEAKRNG